MRTRIAAGLAVFTAVTVCLAGGSSNPAGAQDTAKAPPPPAHLYGHDLRVRIGGKGDFDKDTPRVGVEFFRDAGTKSIIAISDTGALAVTKAPVGELGKDATCKWLTANDLRVRNPGQAEVTQKNKQFGIEMFQDRASNTLLYVCETGSILLAPVPGGLVTDKAPKRLHGLDPRVRAVDQDTFDNAKKFGLEVFRDENTGGLIYITETGAIAPAAAGALPTAKDIKPPKTMYGLVLRVRGGDEPDFTEKTKKMGLEVFEDPNTGVLFYITEAGFVATAPKGGKIPEDARGVTWKSAMALRARKAGEKAFDTAKKYGIEVFEDNRTGNLIFISETGSIAVLPK